MSVTSRILSALLLSLALVSPRLEAAADAASLLRAGSELYRAKRYDEAMKEYAALIEVAPCAASHYNMGVTAFKAGKRGLARLHLERALLYAPRDHDVKSNLEFVKASLGAAPPATDEDLISRWTGAVLARVSLREAALTFLALTWVLGIPFALFLARVGRNPRLLLLITLGALPLWLGGMTVFGAKLYQVEMIRHGIVLVDRVDVRTGPDAGETKRFEMHEGDRVQIVHRSGDWYRIALDTGENGWVESRSIESILAP